MLKTINSYFDEFIEERVIEISSEAFLKNREYEKLNRKAIDFFNKILEQLPQEHKCLLFEYDDTNTELMEISNNFLYRQGLLDGIKISRIFSSHRNDHFGKLERLIEIQI